MVTAFEAIFGAATRALRSKRELHRLAGLDRCRKGALVEIVELAADRHAMGEARDGDSRPASVGQVMRRRLALDGGVQR